MNNSDLILLLGIGLAVTALALIIPAVPRGTVDPGVSRPAVWWVPTVLAAGGAALGIVAVLVIAFR